MDWVLPKKPAQDFLLQNSKGAVHKWYYQFFDIFDPSLPLVTHFTIYDYGVKSLFGRCPLPPLSGWRHLWTAPKRVYILGQAQPTKVLLLHIHSKLHSNPDLLAFIPKSQVLLACYMAFRTFRSIANFHAGARCNFNTFKKTFRRITNDHDFGKKEREKK